jgi:hypothetical protein
MNVGRSIFPGKIIMGAIKSDKMIKVVKVVNKIITGYSYVTLRFEASGGCKVDGGIN